MQSTGKPFHTLQSAWRLEGSNKNAAGQAAQHFSLSCGASASTPRPSKRDKNKEFIYLEVSSEGPEKGSNMPKLTQ